MEIKIYNDPVLRQKCDEVKIVDSYCKKTAIEMFKMMEEKSGIGLAAPQVGITKRFLAVNYNNDEKNIHEKLFLINPVVVEKEGIAEEHEEGCLSIPGVYETVVRSKKVVVNYIDLDGMSKSITTDSFLSVILQHEIDHLDGILFIDYLSALKKTFFRKKWRKLRKTD